jgi:heme-degrading monooxygenase HmoA
VAGSLRKWATDARHRVAQQTGRQKWYEYYKMDIAEIVRVRNFERPPSAATAT